MENNGQEIDEGGDATKGPQEGIGTEEEGRFEGEMADDETVGTEGEAIYEGKMESSGEAPQETEMEPIGESAPDMEVEFIGEAAPETEVESVGEAAPEMEVESVGEAPLEQDIESIGKTIAEMDLDSIGEAILGVNLDSLEGVIPERKVEFTGEVIPQGDVESTGYTIPEGELEVSGREGLEEYTFSEMDEFSERISTPEFTYSDISPWEMTEEEANAAYLYERPRSTEASQRAFGTYETIEQRKESKVSAPRVFAKAPHCSRGSSPCERSLKAHYHHILGFLLLSQTPRSEATWREKGLLGLHIPITVCPEGKSGQELKPRPRSSPVSSLLLLAGSCCFLIKSRTTCLEVLQSTVL